MENLSPREVLNLYEPFLDMRRIAFEVKKHPNTVKRYFDGTENHEPTLFKILEAAQTQIKEVKKLVKSLPIPNLKNSAA